jgi:hypothetical protein
MSDAARAAMHEHVTSSPTRNAVTFAPTASAVLARSSPSIAGGCMWRFASANLEIERIHATHVNAFEHLVRRRYVDELQRRAVAVQSHRAHRGGVLLMFVVSRLEANNINVEGCV